MIDIADCQQIALTISCTLGHISSTFAWPSPAISDITSIKLPHIPLTAAVPFYSQVYAASPCAITPKQPFTET
jgi:hypothetical protein